MCGITGCFERKKSVDDEVVYSMMEILNHRGPDDRGYKHLNVAGGEIGMGFVRLSIRDLSTAGHQPMQNATGEIIITLNGEIYNSEELRPLLIEAGYKFNGTSDTEVLLYLYEMYGIDKMLPMLDGMYAICIVDTRIDSFFLIRDRLGEKPLYIYNKPDFMLYASEYKAFYCHPKFTSKLNEDAVDEYFLFRYVSDGETLLDGVKNLQPGSYMKVDRSGSSTIVYWDLPSMNYNNLNFDENTKRYNELLKVSLRRRLISDRKLGLQLSGGEDSSYLAHLIHHMSNEQLHTFSIVFGNKKYSEEEYQKHVVEKNNCIAHYYEYTPEMFFDCWRECTWYFEAPMNHEGSLGLLLLNRKSKKDVTVMLCGEGADETLGGYGYFYSLSSMLHYPFVRILKALKNGGGISSIQDTFISFTQFIPDQEFCRIRDKGKERKEMVFHKRRTILQKTPGKGIRKYMNYDTKTYMQDILMRADKTSMASSIEMRVPFIMPALVEYACSIPDSQLVKYGLRKNKKNKTKRILKELCSQVYGNEFVNRPKSGFGAPILDFFRDNVVKEYIEQTLLPGIDKRNVLNYAEVEKMWKECLNTKGNDLNIKWPLWCAFSFELWAQMYLDHTPLEWRHIDI